MTLDRSEWEDLIMSRGPLPLAVATIAMLVILISPACAQNVGTTSSALEGGAAVDESVIPLTGAVYIVGGKACSGMLVTPGWVLTAEHCKMDVGASVQLGPATSRVAQAFVHPNFDATLLKLSSALYPQYWRGRDWTWYRRDRFRGTSWKGKVNAYGYGDPNLGALRFGRFNVDWSVDISSVPFYLVFANYIEIDDPTPVLRSGDSGAAILVPDHATPGAWDDYRILGIHKGNAWRAFDHFDRALSAASFGPWFDQTLGRDLDPVLRPDQIMVAIGR